MPDTPKFKKLKDYFWIIIGFLGLVGFPTYRYFQTPAENPAFQVKTEDTVKVEECLENYRKTGKPVLGIQAFACAIEVAATIYPTDSQRAINLCVGRFLTPIKTDSDKTYAEGQCKIQIKAKIASENKSSTLPPKQEEPISDPKTSTDKEHSNILNFQPLQIQLIFPEGYEVSLNEEKNRRGSYQSYNVVNKKALLSHFTEIQFFSKPSLKKFIDTCIKTDPPCFFGDYPSLERFEGQQKAFTEDVSYQNYELKNFDNGKFFVSNRKCSGDSCVIREYTTFIENPKDHEGDTKIDIWIMMDSELKSNESDALFSRLKIKTSGLQS